LGFNSYPTFVGKFDWKFTRKNHLYFVATPFNSSRQIVLDRTIDFQGQTFVGGATIDPPILRAPLLPAGQALCNPSLF
jgi:hypothetical protein